MADTVLFDVNETVLDLGPLRPAFARAFGDPSALVEWFGRLLQTSAVCAVTGVNTTFRELAAAGLDRSAAIFGAELGAAAKDELLALFRALEPHPDVAPALGRLRDAGYRTVAFSNSSARLLETQIENSGLASSFDTILSVEAATSFKPDPKVYLHAVREMDRAPDEVWMLAAHDWDVHGAMSAGLLGAYLARSAAPYHPAYRAPTVRADDMQDLIEQILRGR